MKIFGSRCAVSKLLVGLTVVFMMGAGSAMASPVTWDLTNVSFDFDSGTVGATPGSITATGSFTYDADTHTMLTWDIAVSGSSDTLLDQTYTPSNSYVPSLYNSVLTSVQFVFFPPSHIEVSNGDYPNGTETTAIEFDFHDAPNGEVLTDAGGSFGVLTAITNLYDYSDSETFGVRTGSLTSAPVALTPEPGSLVLVGTGLVAMLRRFRRG
jgi:hypothetical protein